MPRPVTSRILCLLLSLAAATVACGGSKSGSQPAPAVDSSEHALAGLAAQHVVVLPTYAVRAGTNTGWTIPPTPELRKMLDADIVAAFDERGLRRGWIFPEQLDASYRRNASYASDPRNLAEEPLRSPALALDARLTEPLASQLRTLVALHEDARLILAPVEFRTEHVDAGGARGVLRLVLMDARTSNVRWIGEVVSDPSPSFGPQISAGIAAKLAGMVAP